MRGKGGKPILLLLLGTGTYYHRGGVRDRCLLSLPLLLLLGQLLQQQLSLQRLIGQSDVGDEAPCNTAITV